MAPRSSRSDKGPPPPSRTLVIDPGAYTIKAGFSLQGTRPSLDDCRVSPNCLAKSSRDKRIYVGSQLDTCVDFGEMQFKRPVQKGYIVNWPTEVAIWEHEFLEPNAPLHCDPHDTNLVVAETPNAPAALQTNIDQIVFEEFEFASLYRCLSPGLHAWTPIARLFGDEVDSKTAPAGQKAESEDVDMGGTKDSSNPPPASPAECLLVIDSGHTHTLITPTIRGIPLQSAIRRLDIGGKHLTNYLAELISLRHFSLIDEPHIVSQIKQDACFLSTDFPADLDRCRQPSKTPNSDIIADYVLPDYERLHRGFLRAHDPSPTARLSRLLGVSARPQHASSPSASASASPSGPAREESFPLGNERFTVPELLFSPSHIGMRAPGLCETVFQSLAAVPRALWQPLLGNVLLVGGNALIPGFVRRVEQGLRELAPGDLVVRVRCAEDAIKSAWWGGAALAAEEGVLERVRVSREEYAEFGAGWVARQFAGRRAA